MQRMFVLKDVLASIIKANCSKFWVGMNHMNNCLHEIYVINSS